MMKTMPLPPPGFYDLSHEEQVRYVQSLWQLITPAEVSEEELAIIDERLEAHRRNPMAGRPWEEVLAEMRAKCERGE